MWQLIADMSPSGLWVVICDQQYLKLGALLETSIDHQRLMDHSVMTRRTVLVACQHADLNAGCKGDDAEHVCRDRQLERQARSVSCQSSAHFIQGPSQGALTILIYKILQVYKDRFDYLLHIIHISDIFVHICAKEFTYVYI